LLLGDLNLMFPRYCVRLVRLLCLAALVAAATGAHAAVVYDESVNGDLSGDRLNPTTINLLPGVNSLIATTGFSTVQDEEYFRIDLPPSGQLTNVLLQSYSGDNGLMFIGVEKGFQFSFSPDDAFAHIGDLLGWTHFGPNNGNQIGDDLLPAIGMGGGAKGFTPPLSFPPYTFWIQQYDSDTKYQLDFVVAAVPEPATWILMVLGIALLVSARQIGRTQVV
jgi:PEP-CTERM motif-containing protein